MKVKEHVRGALLLSKELLTRSELQGNPGEEEGIAHDIFVSDDAAEMAMGAICSQIGLPPTASPGIDKRLFCLAAPSWYSGSTNCRPGIPQRIAQDPDEPANAFYALSKPRPRWVLCICNGSSGIQRAKVRRVSERDVLTGIELSSYGVAER